MKISEAIEEIGLLMEAVENVGVVHRRERLVQDWPKFVELCKVPELGIARWWIITRTNRNTSLDAGGAQNNNQIVIRGHQPLVDSTGSEHDFQDIADEVYDIFVPENSLRSKRRGGMKIGSGNFIGESLSMNIDLRNVGGITVHFAEIILPTLRRDGFCNV